MKSIYSSCLHYKHQMIYFLICIIFFYLSACTRLPVKLPVEENKGQEQASEPIKKK